MSKPGTLSTGGGDLKQKPQCPRSLTSRCPRTARVRLPMATSAVTTSTAAGASVTTGSLQAYEKKQRGFGRLNQGLIDRQQASKMRLSIRFARSYATFSRMIGSIHPKSARIDVLRRLETTRIAAFETALSHTQNSVNFPFTTHL